MTVVVVRRVIVFVLLFALVTIAAMGIVGLIERAIGGDAVLVLDDAGFARALAFALIGAPVAAALWWWERRRLAETAERASLVWSLYVAAMSVTSLIVAASAAALATSAGAAGEWRPGDLATAVVWAAVWVWHRRMLHRAGTAPTRLSALSAQLSALYGLTVAAFGGISVIAAIVAQALAPAVPMLVDSLPWHTRVLQALIWCVIGALVWWWHWYRERASAMAGAFSQVLLVIVVGASAAGALFSLGTVLHVVHRLLFDDDPVADALAPLDVAIAGALVGAIVAVFHARLLPVRGPRVREAARLTVAGVAVIGVASGFGVVVNALLAGLNATIFGDDPRALLLGGLSALLVGAPTWWAVWGASRSATDAGTTDIARRVYLVVIFGVSAVVALVTLLLIGYRVFETVLGAADPAGAPGGVVERIRVPLGLLSATVLVFVYHFAVWRRDRASAPASRRRRLESIVLVAGGDHTVLAARIHDEIGARVTVWRAADESAHLDESSLGAVLDQLRDLAARRALVVADAGGGARVVPLAG
jgi:hypothetical protein